jgi:FtsP/CotA-like multicopper oxidase with cupredoxin domain
VHHGRFIAAGPSSTRIHGERIVQPHRSLRVLALLAAAGLAAAQAHAQIPFERRSNVQPRVFTMRAPTPTAAIPAGCPALTQPTSISSQNGTLQTTLTMDTATFQIGGVSYTRNVYNNQYVAPTLRMNPGERLVIDVNNNMVPTPFATQAQVDTTNQHFHGMVVTPLPDTGDNVNIASAFIAQGGTNQNRFPVPGDHAQGMMWYHPHPHGSTSPQVNSGLAGALMIGDLLSYPQFAQYRGATEVVMQIKDTKNSAGKAQLNINGNTCSVMTMAPGEQQFWRIGNFAANTFVNLKLDGYRFTLLAMDGNRFKQPVDVDSILIAPGGRAEAIVVGGTGPWTAKFYTAPMLNGSNNGTPTYAPEVDLGWVVVQGTPQAGLRLPRAEAAPLDRALEDSIRQLVADVTDINQFTVHFELGNNGLNLNGLQYDPHRLDISVPVGQTQEWTLINDTNFPHTFHIHQTDFVITSINGVPQPDSVHHDNVWLGVHQLPNGTVVGDTVVARWAFPAIGAGPLVYHCHVLSHEDGGMMANICVYDPAKGQTPAWCMQWFQYTPASMPSGGGHSHGHAIHTARPEPGRGRGR